MITAQDTGFKKASAINRIIILQDNPPGIISSRRFKNSGLFTKLLLGGRLWLAKRRVDQPLQ